MRFFNKSLNDITFKNIIFMYIFFGLIISTLSSIYCYITITKFNLADSDLNIIFKNLQFDYGELTHNMYYNDSFSQNKNGILFYLYKSPLLAIIIVGLAKISKNIFFIFIIKNLFTYSVYFFSAYLSLKSLNKTVWIFILVLFIQFINPYTVHNGLNIFYEDNLAALFLPSLFLLILSKLERKFFLSAILIFLLYLTKTSMFYLSFLFPLLVILIEKKNFLSKIIPLYGVILAIIIWGSFGYIKTDRFPFANSQLSGNSFALNTVILNKKFLEYYPQRSVDLIPQNDIDSSDFKNEWEFYDHYKNLNKRFLKENFFYYLSTIPVKLRFIFFNVHKDSVFPDNDGNYENKFMVSYLINKFFLTFNLFPHVAAWATAKHLVAIQLISMICLLLKFTDKLDYKKNDKS